MIHVNRNWIGFSESTTLSRGIMMERNLYRVGEWLLIFQKSSRIEPLSTGIFAELASEKRRLHEAKRDIIDLSVGSPDLPPPITVRERLSHAASNPNLYGYAITATPDFAQAVAHFYLQRYGVTLEPDKEILQLMGSQDGLAHISMALLNPGDIVLVPDPGYPIYEASVLLAGGILYKLPLLEQNAFLPDLEAIPSEILQRTKMMILNYPGNPVTALANEHFFQQVIAFAKQNEILVVHDFAYSELVFDGHRALSFLAVPGAKEVGIEFNSLSKTFNMAGCRIGYVCGNPSAIALLTLLKSHIDYGVFLPIQEAAIVALTSDFSELQTQTMEYVKRRDVLLDGLLKAGWKISKSPATMFIWAKIPDGWSSRSFSLRLLRESGVAVTPGNAFGQQGEGFVRIALVQPTERLKQAVERIQIFLQTATPE